MLSPRDLNELRAVIEDHNTALIVRVFGAEAAGVSEVEVERLVRAGLLSRDAVQGLDVVRDAHLLGRLRGMVQAETGQALAPLSHTDLMAAMGTAPLSAMEQAALQAARNSAGQYVTALGRKLADQVAGTFAAEDATLRAEQMGKVQDTVAEGIARREGAMRISSRLRDVTKDYSRDWLRVAVTETQAAQEYGAASAIKDDFGADARVAKIPNPDACPKCRALYLDASGRPRIFRLADLEANGTNVGRKARDWRPTVGPVHPWCLLPGQSVMTARGEIAVEDVKVGDFAITHNGRWRRVKQAYKHFHSGVVAEIDLSNGKTLKSTDGHLWRVVGRRGDDWKRADALRNGDEVRAFLPPANADHSPSVSGKPLGLLSILFGFVRGGVPVATVYLDGRLALPMTEIDKIASDNGVVLDVDPESAKFAPGLRLVLAVSPAGPVGDALEDFGLGLHATAGGCVGGGSNCLTLFGGRALVVDFESFASSALPKSGLLDLGRDALPGDTEADGYVEYGNVIVEVQPNDLGTVHGLPPGTDLDTAPAQYGINEVLANSDLSCDGLDRDAAQVHGDDPVDGAAVSALSHEKPPVKPTPIVVHDTVHVKCCTLRQWSGYVYNIGVEEDQSYVVGGVASHNCACVLHYIPDGYDFAAEGESFELRPVEPMTPEGTENTPPPPLGGMEGPG